MLAPGELRSLLRRESARWRDRGRRRPDPSPALPPEVLARQVYILIALGDRMSGPEVISVEVSAVRPSQNALGPRRHCWEAFINGREAVRWRPGPPWEIERRES